VNLSMFFYIRQQIIKRMLTTPGIILDLVEYGTLSDANGQDIMFNLRPITVILKKCGGGQKQIYVRI